MQFARIHKSLITDETWAQFYLQLLQSGRERTTFYCEPRRDVPSFVNLIRESRTPWWLCLKGDIPCATVWLTDVHGKSASIHYTCLPNIPTREVLGLLRYVLAGILYDKYMDGSYIMHTLAGLTPLWNRAGVKLLKHLNATKLGVIPGICYCYDSGANSDGIVSYFTRDSVPEHWIKQ